MERKRCQSVQTNTFSQLKLLLLKTFQTYTCKEILASAFSFILLNLSLFFPPCFIWFATWKPFALWICNLPGMSSRSLAKLSLCCVRKKVSCVESLRNYLSFAAYFINCLYFTLENLPVPPKWDAKIWPNKSMVTKVMYLSWLPSNGILNFIRTFRKVSKLTVPQNGYFFTCILHRLRCSALMWDGRLWRGIFCLGSQMLVLGERWWGLLGWLW